MMKSLMKGAKRVLNAYGISLGPRNSPA